MRRPGATLRRCAPTASASSGRMTATMACGEFGPGRMAEPLEIVAAIEAALADGPLKGRRVLVTSGPTHEPIDPVRYIANRSSGAQGTAIARALAALGARSGLRDRPRLGSAARGRRGRSASRPRGRCATRCWRRCRPMPASSPPPWRTGAWPRSGSKMKKDGPGDAPLAATSPRTPTSSRRVAHGRRPPARWSSASPPRRMMSSHHADRQAGAQGLRLDRRQ